MALHSSTLAWKIPWTEEPGRLQSMGSWRVGHDWRTSLSLFTSMHWRRKWQPTPVFLPGESQGRWSLVGCRLWGSHRVGHDWRDLAAVAACFFYDPVDVGNLISGSTAFSKSSLNIWNFMVHTLLKFGMKDFEDYLASIWNEYNCMLVWTLFGIAFLWDWIENWSFPILWPLMSFPSADFKVQQFNSIIF